MGTEYRSLSVEARQFQNKRAKDDKTRYENELEEYRKVNGFNDEVLKVKKGKSSYNLYLNSIVFIIIIKK